MTVDELKTVLKGLSDRGLGNVMVTYDGGVMEVCGVDDFGVEPHESKERSFIDLDGQYHD